MNNDEIYLSICKLTKKQRHKLGVLNKYELVKQLRLRGYKVTTRTFDRKKDEFPKIALSNSQLKRPRAFYVLNEVIEHLDKHVNIVADWLKERGIPLPDEVHPVNETRFKIELKDPSKPALGKEKANG